MEGSGYAIILEGLSELDRQELERKIPPHNLSFIKPTVPEGTHGELVTVVAVVVISVSAISGLTAWLLTGKSRKKVKIAMRARKPNGSEQEVTIEIDQNSTIPPNEQMLNALAGVFNVPVDALRALNPQLG
jgi:hypothetical protein